MNTNHTDTNRIHPDGGQYARKQAEAPPGCFVYVPPTRVVWNGGSGASSAVRAPAAVDYLARFLCAGFVLVLLATGCAGPRPLKGGRAVTTRKPEGIVEQTLQQGENPAQPTKQTQETVKVRTYTVPTGSRVEQSQTPAASPAQLSTINSQPQAQGSQQGRAGSRAEFCAEMLAARDRLHTNHLAILEKLDANHRELLAALERLATRISALEAGLARVDERTRS